jgi:hypothetical protein
MRPTKYNHPLSFYASKWHTSTVTASNYARRGCDWDASDYEVATWLLKYARKKPPAMREAVYAVPGIRDGDKPEPASEPLDTQAFGAAYEWQERLEAKVAQLRKGDTEQAQLLAKELDALDAEFARLDAMISSS